VAQDIVSHSLDVLGPDVIPAGQPCVCAGAAVQVNRRTRTRAIFEPTGQFVTIGGRIACREYDLNQVFLQCVGQVQVQCGMTCCENGFLGDGLRGEISSGERSASARFSSSISRSSVASG